jgi:DNA-binding NarL/FixJ family response regulator
VALAEVRGGTETPDSVLASGAGMTLEEVLNYVRGPAPRAGSLPAGLTERELQVLRMLGRGLSNRDIADQLIISVRTVDRHVENILAKLHLDSRGQVTAWAAERGLLAIG